MASLDRPTIMPTCTIIHLLHHKAGCLCQPHVDLFLWPGRDQDGINIWCIKGYSGYVNFSKNDDGIETLGRLEIMNQIMHNRHSYDIEKIPRPPTLEKEKEPPRPPTPKKKRGFKTITAKPPPYRQHAYDDELDCELCDKEASLPVKKTKRAGDMALCWDVCPKTFQADAKVALDGH